MISHFCCKIHFSTTLAQLQLFNIKFQLYVVKLLTFYKMDLGCRRSNFCVTVNVQVFQRSKVWTLIILIPDINVH